MSFSIDHNNTGGGKIVPEGIYEVVIKAVYEDVIQKTGTIYINVPLVIRNDIEQPYKNAYIWHCIWKKKEPNENDLRCGGYISANLNALSKAAEIPHGKSYAGLEKLFEDLKDKPLRVKVKHETFNGKTQAKVESMAASKFTTCRHVYKQTAVVSVASSPSAAYNVPETNDINMEQFFTIDDSLEDEDLPF